MKSERVYMPSSDVPNFCKGDILRLHDNCNVHHRKVTHTSVSYSCITVRPLRWFERLLHWLRCSL
jgi:hypothetical protein